MATNVQTTYRASYNTSITVRDGRIDKVTTWQTGVTGSTERTHSTTSTRK